MRLVGSLVTFLLKYDSVCCSCTLQGIMQGPDHFMNFAGDANFVDLLRWGADFVVLKVRSDLA